MNSFLPSYMYSDAICMLAVLLWHNEIVSKNINSPLYFVIINETVIYLNCYPKRTVYSKGEKTAPIMLGRGSRMRFKVAVFVAMDVTKLSFFAIINGTPVGSIDRQLP